MNRLEIEKLLEKNMKRHLSNKVLHAHPSPALWRPQFDEVTTHAKLTTNEGSRTKVNMYAGIPYCLPTNPPHCGFCLFPTENYRGKDEMEVYLSYLRKEAEMYADFYQSSELDSLYIGGGTPNLMRPDDYHEMMSIIHMLFPTMRDDVEKTLEGIPQLFNEDKIKAISEAGFNRVSMGVQQVNDKLIKYSGRKQTRKQVFEAIDLFHKYDLSCNIDLIYAWPEQTIEEMIFDLNEIIQSGIRHITHYELNIAGRSTFATEHKEMVPDIARKIEMYNAQKEFLESMGYRQRTVYDWEKVDKTDYSKKDGAEQYHYENNLRDFIPMDGVPTTSVMGGIGYAAVNMRMRQFDSIYGSVSTMNHKSLAHYYKDIEAGKLPLERVFDHEPEDVKLVWLFQALQEMKINKVKYNEIFKTELNDDFADLWAVLSEKGWIEQDNVELRLINEGEFYVPLVQTLISHGRTQVITKENAELLKATL